MHHPVILVDPEGLGVLLNRPDVGVGSEQDVLELTLFLVCFFDGLLWGPWQSRSRRVHNVRVVAARQRDFLACHHGRRRRRFSTIPEGESLVRIVGCQCGF